MSCKRFFHLFEKKCCVHISGCFDNENGAPVPGSNAAGGGVSNLGINSAMRKVRKANNRFVRSSLTSSLEHKRHTIPSSCDKTWPPPKISPSPYWHVALFFYAVRVANQVNYPLLAMLRPCLRLTLLLELFLHEPLRPII